MRSEPAHLGEISLDFGKLPLRQDENFPNFPYTRNGPARQRGIEFSLISFVLLFRL